MLLDGLIQGKRVINVDESALGQGLFVRKAWFRAGERGGTSVKPFGQRLSLLAAIDTDGLTYFAISQSTTD